MMDSEDTITQLRRRCELYIKMTPLTMNVSIWQNETLRYMLVGTYDNPVKDKYEKKDRTLTEAREYVDNLLIFPSQVDEETAAEGEGFKPISDNEDAPFSTQLELPV